MIEIQRSAEFSDDMVYRYQLDRWWADGPRAAWVMLNPSTADAEIDDPTIRRVMRFSRDWGYAGCTVFNLFALRATDPRELYKHQEPTGDPRNEETIWRTTGSAPIVIAAWGAHGSHLNRGPAMALALAEDRLHHLGLTAGGHPRHPLYLAANTAPVPWRPWEVADAH